MLTVQGTRMTAPLILQRHGSRWEVYLDTAAARRRVGRYKKVARLDALPKEAIVPVVRTGSHAIDLVPGGRAHRFDSRDEAEGVAHKIGRYMLGLGDFVHAYSEVREGVSRTGATRSFRRTSAAWFRRRRDRRRRSRGRYR